jgi:MFS family permease
MAQTQTASNAPWWRELNRYHWFVLIVAALGWLFDCLDQQIFTLSRFPAMKELLSTPEAVASQQTIIEYGGYATSIFLIGWATGGLIFGVIGDRYGRAKTMLFTILIYSICTGLSAFSVGFWDFAFYRFVTGLGVGGEFAVGVSLVAEVMPDRARPYAIGLLQALSAFGNIAAALLSILFGRLEAMDVVTSAWRPMYLVGAIPAFLAIFIRRRLKEPEKWQAAAAKKDRSELGSYRNLFKHPVWRKNALVGLALACSGVIGLWAIGFFSADLIRTVMRSGLEAQGLQGAALSGKLSEWAGVGLIMFNIAGFFGIYSFGVVSQRIGRKPTFALSLLAAFFSTIFVFWKLQSFSDLFWMLPLMGFCQLSLFGGYAIYFPELFPTSLRSTGVSFCYNVGRFVAAVGPTILALLTAKVFEGNLRHGGMAMCAVFLIGLFVLPFAPETKGEALPEDQKPILH